MSDPYPTELSEGELAELYELKKRQALKRKCIQDAKQESERRGRRPVNPLILKARKEGINV